ncbi:MAG: hypothetical protein SH850_13205 [Planctomycetaceae bacterium]|nr:hypothetical protein [Planctomycetaceae bacterium]
MLRRMRRQGRIDDVDDPVSTTHPLIPKEIGPVLQSVKGICRNGRVELLEPAPAGGDGDVIVTFLVAGPKTLADRGIDEPHAAELRRRLAAFAEDWDQPDMDSYDAL